MLSVTDLTTAYAKLKEDDELAVHEVATKYGYDLSDESTLLSWLNETFMWEAPSIFMGIVLAAADGVTATPDEIESVFYDLRDSGESIVDTLTRNSTDAEDVKAWFDSEFGPEGPVVAGGALLVYEAAVRREATEPVAA